MLNILNKDRLIYYTDTYSIVTNIRLEDHSRNKFE